MIGDQGFDPLGITNTIPSLNYVRAAELKHGRVAMLATVGFVFQQYVHIVSSEADPLKAVSALGYGPNLQILFAIGCIELSTWDVTFTSTTPGKKVVSELAVEWCLIDKRFCGAYYIFYFI